MAKIFPLHPKHPERICWGCDKYCRADDLQCGNGSIRIAHPCEDFGEHWYEQGDWSGLLNAQQWTEITRKSTATLPTKPAPLRKPHIKLIRQS
ncbi:DUF3079 domain-containing protein [Snodgrassella sp. CFCC 13594]|uniref:DUF3079 domain-containing protein n=1 Tax=Snodgrassella sp. CFCC 13594 TaxID=1775559 RepID=UPI0008337A0F|nr:DUF3079 domain-containing protein [Snodgrassella sp. CFCC 13594]